MRFCTWLHVQIRYASAFNVSSSRCRIVRRGGMGGGLCYPDAGVHWFHKTFTTVRFTLISSAELIRVNLSKFFICAKHSWGTCSLQWVLLFLAMASNPTPISSIKMLGVFVIKSHSIMKEWSAGDSRVTQNTYSVHSEHCKWTWR